MEIGRIINELLFREIVAKKSQDMFGVDKWLTKKKINELRDHHDRF